MFVDRYPNRDPRSADNVSGPVTPVTGSRVGAWYQAPQRGFGAGIVNDRRNPLPGGIRDAVEWSDPDQETLCVSPAGSHFGFRGADTFNSDLATGASEFLVRQFSWIFVPLLNARRDLMES